MLGYIFAIAVLVYFFIIWPKNDGFPPITQRTLRQRLAGKLGLHDTPSVGELFLSDEKKYELIDNLTYTDATTYATVAKSNHFYLVEERQSVLSIYCSRENPIGPVDYSIIKTRNFLGHLNQKQKIL